MRKALPHRPEAEAAILAGIILRGVVGFVEVADVVREEDFFVPAHQAVFRSMRALVERGDPIDTVTLEAELDRRGDLRLVGGGRLGTIEALDQLVDRYATSRNIAHHATLVRRAAVVRATVLAAEAIAEEGLADPADVDEYVDRSEARIMEVQHREHAAPPTDARGLMVELMTDLKAPSDGGLTGVGTGFGDLDHLTGGLQPGDLVVLAARPSMGKTALALNIMENAGILSVRDALAGGEHLHRAVEQLEPVLFQSIEMGKKELGRRVLASQARVDGRKLKTKEFIADEFERVVSASGRIARSPLHIDDPSSPTVLELRARARRWRRKQVTDAGPCQACGVEFVGPRCPAPRCGRRRPIGLVVVDYLQLVRGAGKYQSREQEVADVSRNLKAMAKELQVPVLALSQLNRAVEGRADHRPQMSDLRESGGIEQDADVILFVHREERYVSDEEKRRAVKGQAEVIVGKQRSGALGTVALTYFEHLTRFEPRARED